MRFYRIILNLLSSVSRNLLGMVIGLVATPFILKFLGADRYGAFRVLVDWMGQLTLLEFGLFTALLPIYAESLAGKRRSLYPSAVASQALKKYFLVILYQLTGFGLIYVCLDILIPVEEALQEDLRSAAIVMGVSLLTGFSQVYRAYIDASQRAYIISTTMIGQNIILIGLSVLLAYLEAGITGQAIAMVTSQAITFLVLYLYSYKELRHLKTHKLEGKKFDFALKRQRGPNFFAALFGRLSLVCDNIIISFFLGPKAVTAFFLTQRLIKIGRGQLQQLGNATWPAMSEIYYGKEREKFADRLIDVTELIALASGALLTVLVFVNPPFVKLWTGESTFAGLMLSNLAIAGSGLVAINSFWLWCFTGTGFIRKALPMLGVQAAVNLFVSFTATYYWGMIGPLLGTFVSFLCVSQVWLSILLNKEFQVPLLRLSIAWLVPFLLPVSLAVVAVSYLGHPEIDSWLLLALFAIGLSVVVLAIYPFIFVRKASRIKIYSRVQALIKRKLAK